MMVLERRILAAALECTMNTTALRARLTFPSDRASIFGAAKDGLRSTARDFVSGLLSVTKSGLLSQQATRPRLRRF